MRRSFWRSDHIIRPTLLGGSSVAPAIVLKVLLYAVLFCVFAQKHTGMAFRPLLRYEMGKAITNYGDLAMYANILEKLRTGQCLNITVIGGSVTAGNFNFSVVPLALRWHQVLGQMLQEKYPCGPGGHQVTSLGKGSTSTRWWIHRIVGQQEVLLNGSDLVMMETAVNQNAVRDIARKEEETLLSMVTLQSKRSLKSGQIRGFTGTASMFVVASSRFYFGMWTGVPYTRLDDAMYAQLPVARHHGVPIISVIDAYGPFPTPASQSWFNRTWYSGRPWGDKIHPDAGGHKVIAELVMNYLDIIYEYSYMMREYELPKVYVPRMPTFVEQSLRDFYLDSTPVTVGSDHFKARSANFTGNCKDWVWDYDVPKRGGFLSRRPASPCVIYFSPAEVQGLSSWEVHVELLKSYVHMGTVDMSVYSGVAQSNGSCVHSYDPNSPSIGSLAVDCLWDERASLVKVESWKLQKPAVVDPNTCLFVKFVIQESSRDENKIKLLGVSLF